VRQSVVFIIFCGALPMASRCLAAVLGAIGLATACLVASAQTPAVVLRQASNSPPGTVFHDYWLRYKAKVEADSGGSVKVELNTNEPNEGNLLSNLRRNRVQCTGTSLQGAATILPEVAVLQLPYLFTSHAQVDHSYGNELTAIYKKLFAAKGVELVSFVEVGFTGLYSVMPIKSPTDVKGLKLRASQARASQAFVKATGAEVVVLPIAELVPGLQTGLVKGGEGGVIVYDALISKTAPHYTLTQHAFDSGVVLCNKEWLDGLSAAQRDVVLTSYDFKGQRAGARAAVDKILTAAKDKGITVHRPTEAELAPWRAAGQKAADEIMATLGLDAAQIRAQLVNSIQSAPK
jgi:TRAP-type transport system periplasmic protein